MKKYTITAQFKSNIQKVWDIVTDNSQYKWRSDIIKIEVSTDGLSFIEYAPKNVPTYFSIQKKIYLKRYEFTMHNQFLRGRWVGIFTELENKTIIKFTEEVSCKNSIMNLFIKTFLKKQQAQYIADLRKVLGE